VALVSPHPLGSALEAVRIRNLRWRWPIRLRPGPHGTTPRRAEESEQMTSYQAAVVVVVEIRDTASATGLKYSARVADVVASEYVFKQNEHASSLKQTQAQARKHTHRSV